MSIREKKELVREFYRGCAKDSWRSLPGNERTGGGKKSLKGVREVFFLPNNPPRFREGKIKNRETGGACQKRKDLPTGWGCLFIREEQVSTNRYKLLDIHKKKSVPGTRASGGGPAKRP